MRITDPRWPAVREMARTMLRTENLEVRGPSWLETLLHEMNMQLGEVQPSRLRFPAFEKGDEASIVLRNTAEDSVLAQCSGEEPPLHVVWLPMEPEAGWTTISSIASDLLEAGYPGCLGCGGPHTEGTWDELNSRKSMREFTNSQP
jgi:hypothetical protein